VSHCGRTVLAMDCVLAGAEKRRAGPLNSVVRFHFILCTHCILEPQSS
jgi:hypothetical protein